MTNPDKPTPNQSPRLSQIAIWCAFLSGFVSIVGIVFLIAFFGFGASTGRLNDIAVIIQYSLMLPIALAMYQILKPKNPSLSWQRY